MLKIVNAKLLLLNLAILAHQCVATTTDIVLDAKAETTHRVDSLSLLAYTFLIILTVLTIWLFKHRRVSFLHETGLAVIYGLIVGAIIRYSYNENTYLKKMHVSSNDIHYNSTLPPDLLTLHFPLPNNESNKTYQYVFEGSENIGPNEINVKSTFDPEIFINIILPPIIFHAGYSLKRNNFFNNFGAILTYAIIGTTISSFVVGSLMYYGVQWMPVRMANSFTYLDTLYFGALISATDPLAILAIFHDLNVDVNLYAMVFGESVLNDAVSIVLSGSIQNYGKHYQSGSGEFECLAFLKAAGNFVAIFMLSLFIGVFMGCITALMTKFTKVKEYPLLESSLFVLMSYSTFLMAESAELTGVVSVLFCGICQAHYTYSNLSDDSKLRTKQIFELINFLAENFIFSYIGVSMFTFPKHNFDVVFILMGLICTCIGRAANIYPLTFLLNLGRKSKIPANYQHMLFFAGLRGAMCFALAIRNTVSEARQAMLTTTSLIVIFTVVFQGGAASSLLRWFKIPACEEDSDSSSVQEMCSNGNETDNEMNMHDSVNRRKSSLIQEWSDFDKLYMKPLLTHSRPALIETLPLCCMPIARFFTTSEQMVQEKDNQRTVTVQHLSTFSIQEQDGPIGDISCNNNKS